MRGAQGPRRYVTGRLLNRRQYLTKGGGSSGRLSKRSPPWCAMVGGHPNHGTSVVRRHGGHPLGTSRHGTKSHSNAKLQVTVINLGKERPRVGRNSQRAASRSVHGIASTSKTSAAGRQCPGGWYRLATRWSESLIKATLALKRATLPEVAQREVRPGLSRKIVKVKGGCNRGCVAYLFEVVFGQTPRRSASFPDQPAIVAT